MNFKISQKSIFLKIVTCATIIFSIFTTNTAFAQKKGNKTSVLVVRGGHPYDTPDFEKMCNKLKGVNVDLALTAHFESMKVADIKAKYDAILFLNQNKHYKEYKRNKKRYIDLTKEGVGMVFLHFTLSSQPEWDEYHDIIGGKWFLGRYTKDKSKVSTYFMEETQNVKVLDKNHPVTTDVVDFTLTDTFYGKIYTDPNIHPLLGSDDPKIGTIAWANKYNNSKIVYLMPGFTKKAYENSSYKKLVANALKYVGTP